MSLRQGKSANILGGASLAGTVAKQHAGGQGAFTEEELPKVLRHLGITDYAIANKYGTLDAFHRLKQPHFVVALKDRFENFTVEPKFRSKTYSKMACGVSIGNTNYKAGNAFHAITGFVCGGKGYLFDSNQRKPFECNWWNWKELEKVVNNEVARFYDFFSGGQINFMSYSYIIYSKNSYIDSIVPSCQLSTRTQGLRLFQIVYSTTRIS
jgi:hypothetical protein